LKVIAEKNKSYKELQNAIKNKSSRIQDLQQNYKTLRNKCTSLLRITKENYYSNLINDNKNDIKVLWNILSKFFETKNQRKSQENNEIDLDQLNEHFVEI
jgi:hypothetical protein